MKMTIPFGAVCLVVLLAGAIGCGDSESSQAPDFFEQIDDPLVEKVLRRALAKAGGVQTYHGIEEITYTKRSVLYLEDGSVESDALQKHAYILQPKLSGDIRWSDSIGEHRVSYDNGKSSKELDGAVVANGELSASRTFMSAYYVLFMPFKLLDPGVALSYEGQRVLDNGVKVDVIKADYNPDANDNHSTSDVWWYFFDSSDGGYVASMVYHPPTYALIENNKTTSEHPIVFNTYRKSYRVDSLGNKEYLRGEFYYSDFEVK